MGDLSANFSLDEFRCHHCQKSMIDNNLIISLQQLRNVAEASIKIDSGYRCKIHNAAIGGSPNSYHVRGMAADIVIQGKSVREMYELAVLIPGFRNGGIGIYPDNGFIHVDVRGKIARWARVGGKYIGINSYLEI